MGNTFGRGHRIAESMSMNGDVSRSSKPNFDLNCDNKEEFDLFILDKEENNKKSMAIEVPTLKRMCINTLANPKTLRDRLLVFRILHDIDTEVSFFVDDNDAQTIKELRKRSEAEMVKYFAAILNYYEGENDIIAKIIGEKYFQHFSDTLKEKQEGKDAFANYRRGSVLEKESNTLTKEEKEIFETKHILPYRILKAGVQWPENIDSTKREQYLSDEEFSFIFGMDRSAYNKLYSYQRTALKKEKHMF